MANIIVISIVFCIIGGISFYLYRGKKKGKGCIGCPYCSQCGKK